MIIYALIARTRDGLALSASTDADNVKEVRENRKFMKILSKKVATCPDRCSLKVQDCLIHFITSLGVSFMALCEMNYPPVLAFSFVDELMKEFITLYSTTEVNNALRPYAFIQFDHFIQKTRQRYNNPRSLTTKLDLSNLSTEIRLRPPHQLLASDIEPVANGVQFVSVQPRMVPISWLGLLSMSVTAFCLLFNFVRGLSSLGQSTLEEYDGTSPIHGMAFMFEAFLQVCQVYLLLFFTRWRTVECFVTLLGISLCNMLAWEVREVWQIMLHVGLASCMAFSIFIRRLETKSANYNV